MDSFVIVAPDGRQLPLDRYMERLSGQGISLGSSPTLPDIRLAFPGVEPKHARLWLDEGRLVIQDLGSRSGTWVDNEKIPHLGRVPLRAGQEFTLGDIRLQVRVRRSNLGTTGQAAAGAERPGNDFAEDLAWDESGIVISSFDEEGFAVRYVVHRGEAETQEPLCVIGRHTEQADFVLMVASVSRKHASIGYDAELGFTVRDEGSTYGTMIQLGGQNLQVGREWRPIGKARRILLGSDRHAHSIAISRLTNRAWLDDN